MIRLDPSALWGKEKAVWYVEVCIMRAEREKKTKAQVFHECKSV